MNGKPSAVPWLILVGAMALAQSSTANSENWYPYTVDVWTTPFDMKSAREAMQYEPVEKASKAWDICVSFQHLKDAYWTAVNYGVVDEAKRSGVKMQLVEAGGYTNLNTQLSQIEDCVASGADAVIVGAISYDGLNNLVKNIAKSGVPVIDIVNGMSSQNISAKSLVSFGEMGAKIGQYLAERHQSDKEKVKVGWFPGPPGSGWVEAGNKGFQSAVEGSNIDVVDTKYGDTGKEVQLKLVEDTLEAHPDLDYIVGTAVTAEAATSLLRARGLTEQIGVLSYYFTPGVYQGIKRNLIVAAPTDSAVIQGRVAIDQAIRILEGKPYTKHVGPQLYVIDETNINSFDRNSSLAPANFKPTFTVEPQ